MSLPLSRFKVIDLTRARAGPTAVRVLADWGADVVTVEAKGPESGLTGKRYGPDFQNLHRNTRSMEIDLKQPEGLEVFYRMVREADVIVENYRPDVKFKLKIDYETVKKINPRIVYGSVSGFGQDGPYRDRPGLDAIAQGMGGLMSVTGLPGQGPVRAGIPIADLTSGMFCAIGILVALLEREASGEGQWVTTSLLEAQIGMLDFQAARWLIEKHVPKQAGNNHPTGIPANAYQTSDGAMNIQSGAQNLFARLCKALGAERLIDDPDYATADARREHRDALNEEIEAITKTKTTGEWVEIMTFAGVPCGPIYSIDEVFGDPQVKHLGMAQPVDSPKLGRINLVRQAVSLSRTPSKLRTATPERGEHTDVILRELGYGDAEIAALHTAGTV